MANTQVEKIKVKGFSKFGFQLENGEYINFSKTIKDADKGRIVPGGEFEVEMYRADSGKGYVNKVLGSSTVAAPVVPPLVAPVFKNTPTVKLLAKKAEDNSMSKSDWAAKDRSMMVGGLSHDAAVLAAAAATANVPIEQLLKDYRTSLDLLLGIRAEVK